MEMIRQNGFLVSDWNGVWVIMTSYSSDLKQKYSEKLESLGDAALSFQKSEEANMYYTTAIALNPLVSKELLMKWGKIRLTDGLWKEALDAAIKVCLQLLIKNTIKSTLYFAFKLKVLKFEAYQAICEVLKDTGSLTNMVECLKQMASDLQINTMTRHDSRLKWFESK